MVRKRINLPPLSVETVKERIGKYVEAQRLRGKRVVLTFYISFNERQEIERVDVHPPKMRLA
jgi:hypothetical protein